MSTFPSRNFPAPFHFAPSDRGRIVQMAAARKLLSHPVMKYRPNRQSCSPQKGPPFRGVRSAVRQHAIHYRTQSEGPSSTEASLAHEDGSTHLRFLTVLASLPA